MLLSIFPPLASQASNLPPFFFPSYHFSPQLNWDALLFIFPKQRFNYAYVRTHVCKNSHIFVPFIEFIILTISRKKKVCKNSLLDDSSINDEVARYHINVIGSRSKATIDNTNFLYKVKKRKIKTITSSPSSKAPITKNSLRLK